MPDTFASLVLHEDNHLLVVCKPAGLLVQGDTTGRPDLLSLAKSYLKVKYHKPGKVFLGLVHRLDRPVSGVIVLARTSKAAARLCQQFRDRSPVKKYTALVEGRPPAQGKWRDLLARRGSLAVIDPDGRPAQLTFRRLDQHRDHSRVEVLLETGRHHQIRLQFASRGYPVLGDHRYGARLPLPPGNGAIALHSSELTINHPTTSETLRLMAPPPRDWPA